jgi:hypothetical protein
MPCLKPSLSSTGAAYRIPEYIKRAKNQNDDFRLMGFGQSGL